MHRQIKTNNYGDRLLIAYETTECLFGDCGIGTIGEDGCCYIAMDPIFAETTENYNNVKVLMKMQKYWFVVVLHKKIQSNLRILKGLHILVVLQTK